MLGHLLPDDHALEDGQPAAAESLGRVQAPESRVTGLLPQRLDLVRRYVPLLARGARLDRPDLPADELADRVREQAQLIGQLEALK